MARGDKVAYVAGSWDAWHSLVGPQHTLCCTRLFATGPMLQTRVWWVGCYEPQDQALIG